MSKTPSEVTNRIPFFRTLFPSLKLLVESAAATKGVIPVEKPRIIDIAINKKLFPRLTAASGAVPSFPTITLSTKPTMVWPNKPKITGQAN